MPTFCERGYNSCFPHDTQFSTERGQDITQTTFTDSLATAIAQTGESLDALSRRAPQLVVFLRHGG